MKITAIFSIGLMMLACLLIGCGDDDDDDALVGPGGTGGNGSGNGIPGFAAMTPGAWAELTTPEGYVFRSEYIGTDTYNGRECFIMELDTTAEGQKSTDQIWIDKTTYEAVLFVMKSNGTVMKLDISQIPETPGDTSEEIPQGAQQIGKDKYTTPTGKEVEAIIYSLSTPMGQNEIWTSEQVPFGEVLSKLNGNITEQLYDFAWQGAVRDISHDEAMNAQPFEIPGIPGGGDIPGGDIPGGDIPDNPDNPGDEPGGQQIGGIAITVQGGVRPTFTVSQPVQNFMIIGTGVVWGFMSINEQDPGFPGPFQYGVVPPNAVELGIPNPLDMVPGQTYTITVSSFVNGVVAIGGIDYVP